jgi:MYXO-CTERM domain-containing protein
LPVRIGCWVLVAAAASTIARDAAANGRFPASNRIVLAPTDPTLLAVRATYGVLLSHDDGATWAFLCEDAIGLPPTTIQDPPLAITAAPALVAGTAVPVGGLDVSLDMGCNWSCAGGPLAGQTVVDVTVRPDATHTVLALTSTFAFDAAEGGADAAATSLSRVFQSIDDGSTWTPMGVALDPSVLPTSLEVAATDAGRLYVSATRGFGGARTASLFVSTDGGATWVERPVPIDGARNETSAYIGAVDPADADRVYLRTDGQSQLLVSVDAGQSFKTLLSLSGRMLGFALAPDGAAVYAGSVEDGLFMGTRSSTTLAQRSNIDVQCLATRGSELWACSDDQRTGFVAGVSTDQGATFAPKLHLGSVGAPIACAPNAPGAATACWTDANAAACSGAPFAQLCASLGCSSNATSSATSLGSSSSATSVTGAKPSSSSCGCESAGAPSSAIAGLAGSFAAVAAAMRRRRRGAS